VPGWLRRAHRQIDGDRARRPLPVDRRLTVVLDPLVVSPVHDDLEEASVLRDEDADADRRGEVDAPRSRRLRGLLIVGARRVAEQVRLLGGALVCALSVRRDGRDQEACEVPARRRLRQDLADVRVAGRRPDKVESEDVNESVSDLRRGHRVEVPGAPVL